MPADLIVEALCDIVIEESPDQKEERQPDRSGSLIRGPTTWLRSADRREHRSAVSSPPRHVGIRSDPADQRHIRRRAGGEASRDFLRKIDSGADFVITQLFFRTRD
jgi:hypothetical protein